MTKSVIRHREEVINTVLGILLSRHGVSADSETIQTHGRQRPDVMFLLGGARVVVEGKYADVTNAEDVVLGDARARVRSGICHVAVALVYPESLRTVSAAALEPELAAARLRYRVISETGETDWAEGKPSELLASLRRTHEAMTKDDIVSASAKGLADRIEAIAALWSASPATCDRLSVTLGMPAKRGEKADERDGRRVTATKVAALVLANAMVFQEQLATSGGKGDVESIRRYDNAVNPAEKLKRHWHWIWTEVDYVPIFQIGEAILQEVPVSQAATSAIRWLLDEAKSICANQSALRHDLMGRIYHWLLHNGKYLGTYYTGTAAATMLLKLVFAQPWPGIDFGNPDQLGKFTLADLACGTGTLLMAGGQALTDKFITSRVASDRGITAVDLTRLHKIFMENILYGYDVLPSAVHLTASTLGMLAPEVTYTRMNLFVMPVGVRGRTTRLGSLDFIDHGSVPTQFTLDSSQMEVTQTGVAAEHYAKADVPRLNLCAMNPPFVRSVGGNLLFGSLPDADRAKLQKELKRRARNLHASITAGLGSVFVAIADQRLLVGGRLAFILPIALATGEAWGATRQLIAANYHLEMVIASHDAERPNFSENTDLSEAMFIARKLRKGEAAGRTTFVNLWHNPATIYEALDIASRVRGANPAEIRSSDTTVIRGPNNEPTAEAVSLPPTKGTAQWMGVQFAQTAALRAAARVAADHVLAVPGQAAVNVPLCRVSDIGALGNDRRDIHDAFERADFSPYPAFWNHDAKAVLSIHQEPNAYLTPRCDPAAGRTKIKDYESVWGRAGRVLLAERLWPITHRVLAIGLDQPVLGNTWWALDADINAVQEKALLLWLNSTPALLLLLAHRVATRSAWMQMKKPQWASMPVLDARGLTAPQLDALARVYDSVAHQELQALARLDTDPVRAQIDAALSVTLGMPDLKYLRRLLAREPGLTGKGLYQRPGQAEMFDTRDDSREQHLQIDLL